MNDPEQNVRALKRCCVRFKVPDFIETKLYSRKVCKTDVDLELFKDNVKIVEDQCRRLVGGRRNYSLNHPCCYLECELPDTLFAENNGEIGLDESVLLEHIHRETKKAMEPHRQLPGNKCVRTASKRPLEFHRQHPVAEPKRSSHDATPSRNDASQKGPVAECSEVSPPSRGKGADDFRKAVVYLKEYSDEPAFRNKLAVCEEEYNAMERKLEVILAERFEKPPPSCSQDHHKFRGAMNELKDMVGGNVYRYVLDKCEEVYYAKAREMEDSSVVSPSIACGDCDKMLGSVHDPKKMVTAPSPSPDSRNDVEKFKKALNALKASEDAPEIARELAAIEAHFDKFVLHAKDDYNKRHVLAVLMNASNLLGKRKTDQGSILPKVHVNLG
ncbi:uncharacterized protein [Physcomitrium patens]|uniref:uncharacterized protein isoform X2 n=1 Tax=Physcomitrium patens TaxID=3218 RepID=UPI000D17E716|nr:uncharacterized protein LOC112285178 isoform X2 [Physcomitrium patens]|eukprot:XP_024381574.1 uncharacterized protein LOC112285178 isoform X2 [Physcomitrella patens]